MSHPFIHLQILYKLQKLFSETRWKLVERHFQVEIHAFMRTCRIRQRLALKPFLICVSSRERALLKLT